MSGPPPPFPSHLVLAPPLPPSPSPGGDWCGRAEFALAMLVSSGKVTEDDIQRALQQFDRLDVEKGRAAPVSVSVWSSGLTPPSTTRPSTHTPHTLTHTHRLTTPVHTGFFPFKFA